MSIDFNEIRESYPLPSVLRSLGFELRKSGREFECTCPFHADRNPSFQVYQNRRGVWKFVCHPCAMQGDVLDFVCEYYGIGKGSGSRKKAAEHLTGQVKCDPIQRDNSPPPPDQTFTRPPESVERMVAGERTPRIWNHKRGRHVTYTPTAVYPYTDRRGNLLSYVLRLEFDGKKITPWVGYSSEHGWSLGSAPDPRPLYRLANIHQNPGKDVLIVEGEKCADSASSRLKDENLVATCWIGGTNAVKQTYWKSLEGRTVYVWPDNDDGGRKAAEDIRAALHGIAESVHIFDTEGINRADGWDVADWTDASQRTLEDFVYSFKTSHLTVVDVELSSERDIVETNYMSYSVPDDTGAALKTSPMNCQLLLEFGDRYRGLFGWDDFSKQVVLLRRPPWQSGWSGRRPVTDDDLVLLRSFLDHDRISVKLNDLGGIVTAISKYTTFHPLRDALDSLEWDGVPRISGGITGEGDSVRPWLSEYMEADDTPANKMFGEMWLIAAVARAYEPGCKVDNILVLEGGQGVKKSTAIRTLSDAVFPGYFTDEVDKPGSKDAGLQLQGKWHIELGELSAMSRASVEEVKAWVSRQTDRFRPPFGRLPVEYPRVCIFSATTNPIGDTGYLRDHSGARRFWPVLVHHIHLDQLAVDARQLWAEAVHRYKSGEKWWAESEEEKSIAAEAQDERLEHDPYMDVITELYSASRYVSLTQLMDAVGIPSERRSTSAARRISGLMFHMGWRAVRRNGRLVFERD